MPTLVEHYTVLIQLLSLAVVELDACTLGTLCERKLGVAEVLTRPGKFKITRFACSQAATLGTTAGPPRALDGSGNSLIDIEPVFCGRELSRVLVDDHRVLTNVSQQLALLAVVLFPLVDLVGAALGL